MTHLQGGPVTVSQGESNVAVPVTNGGAFTQRANDLVQYAVFVDTSVPSYIECAPTGPVGPGLIDVSGNPVFLGPGSGTDAGSFVGPAPPAADIARTLTVTGFNACTTPGADITINSIDVYILGVR